MINKRAIRFNLLRQVGGEGIFAAESACLSIFPDAGAAVAADNRAQPLPPVYRRFTLVAEEHLNIGASRALPIIKERLEPNRLRRAGGTGNDLARNSGQRNGRRIVKKSANFTERSGDAELLSDDPGLARSQVRGKAEAVVNQRFIMPGNNSEKHCRRVGPGETTYGSSIEGIAVVSVSSFKFSQGQRKAEAGARVDMESCISAAVAENWDGTRGTKRCSNYVNTCKHDVNSTYITATLQLAFLPLKSHVLIICPAPPHLPATRNKKSKSAPNKSHTSRQEDTVLVSRGILLVSPIGVADN